MSGDPKSDLLRRSGPLGDASSVPQKVLQQASNVEASIISQNDQIIRQQGEMKGSMDRGFVGVHGRIGHLEARVVPLERFNDRIMMVPQTLEWFIKVGGFGGIVAGLYAVTKFLGWTH